ncbi:MAG: serine hydrolase domain-containing protein [Bacteroidia bacterium]|nr:serine hydrolase domain-containing protein [Bacteroidia bacterium]
MKSIIATGILLSFSLLYGQHTAITRLDGSTISSDEIDKTVTRLMQEANVQGLSLSILTHNTSAYIKTYGYKNMDERTYLDTATVLYAASFSKAVFGYLVMKLVQEKVIALDKPLYTYLPKPISAYAYFEELASDERWKLMTARMCLSHTTGLPNVRWFHPTTGVMDSLGVMKIYLTPGTRYAYSGEGIKLLQLVIEEITQKTVEELAVEKVFNPIGMTRTGYIWYDRFDDNYAIGHLEDNTLNPKRKRTVPVAGGSLVTTLADYTKFIAYVMQQKGLDKKHFKEMITPQIDIYSKTQFPTITEETTTENRDIRLAYGLGWGLLKCKYGRAFFKEGHDDAWRNYNINFIDKGISIIIITNSANGEFIFKELLETIIGDTCTPWRWEGYHPYNASK